MKSLREQIQDLVLHDKGASDFRIGQILQLVEDRINDLDHWSREELNEDRKTDRDTLFVKTSDLMKLLSIKIPEDDCDHEYKDCVVSGNKVTLCYNCGTEK